MKLLIIGAASSFTAAAANAAMGLSHGPASNAMHDSAASTATALTSPLMAAVTLGISGAYALAASGKIKPLPFMRGTIWAITALYLVRGLFLIPQLLGQNIFADSAAGLEDLVFSALILAVGMVHLAGLSQRS
jgi:hypothetical protein